MRVSYMEDLHWCDRPLVWRGADADGRPVVGCLANLPDLVNARGRHEKHIAVPVSPEAMADLLADRADALSMFTERAVGPVEVGVITADPAPFDPDPRVDPADHLGAGLYCGPDGPMGPVAGG